MLFTKRETLSAPSVHEEMEAKLSQQCKDMHKEQQPLSSQNSFTETYHFFNLLNIVFAVIALSIMYWTIINGLMHCSLILLLLAFLSVTYITFRAILSILYK